MVFENACLFGPNARSYVWRRPRRWRFADRWHEPDEVFDYIFDLPYTLSATTASQFNRCEGQILSLTRLFRCAARMRFASPYHYCGTLG
jgi:hypothetical protein